MPYPKKVHKKQRHTARRIFERLRDEYGYTGGKTVVKEAVSVWRRTRAEVFVPLTHRPGEAQVDFGAAEITLDGQVTKLALFVMTLPYCDATFCCAFPRECTEAFLEGHVRAFSFFGGVPRRISLDYVPGNIIPLMCPTTLCGRGSPLPPLRACWARKAGT